jgi:hypothetical protein
LAIGQSIEVRVPELPVVICPTLIAAGSGTCRENDGLRLDARADSIFLEPALFFALPHFLTANRIHFAEKCSHISGPCP